MSDIEYYWTLLPLGYVLTIALEIPVLLIGLSSVHPFKRKLAAGFWLTACTYPIVVVVLPILFDIRQQPEHYNAYLIVAEIFAPLAECILFALAFHHAGTPRSQLWRDMIAIVIANLISFIVGMFMPLEQWIGLAN